METEVKKPKNKAGRIIKIFLLVILGLILAALITVYAVWHNEIGTILSLEQLTAVDDAHEDGATFYLDMKGGYYLDDYIEQGGCATDSDLVSFVVQHITKGLVELSITPGETGCSSFTAETSDGDRIFGRNYDMKRTGTCIVHCDPGHGRHESYSTIDFRFISVGQEGPLSLYKKALCLAAAYVPMDGMNDAGVSVGIYMSNQGTEGAATDQNTDKPDFTSSAMVRLILDYADDVDEAIELVSQYDLHDSAGYSYHYMIADAQGNSAVLEWVNDTYAEDNDVGARKLVVTRNDGNFQTCTNYIVAEGYYDSFAPEEREEHMGGFDRREFLENALSATEGKIADEEEAMQLLNDVSRRDWAANPGLTIHSVVYNLTEKTVYWVGNEHYGEEAYTFRYACK